MASPKLDEFTPEDIEMVLYYQKALLLDKKLAHSLEVRVWVEKMVSKYSNIATDKAHKEYGFKG